MDMPHELIKLQIYKNKKTCTFLNNLGFNVKPCIRWGNKETYDDAFNWIAENQIVAIGTLGCSKSLLDKYMLLDGFEEFVIRRKPFCIIIYGPIIKELKILIERLKVKIIHFECETSIAFREK